MNYQVTEQNILLIYGIIVLLKINFPVALVIHFPPISISLTINWESQLHKCSSGEPMPKKPLNQKNQSKITKSTKTCLKPVTLDNSVMPALEPICSLMQSLCPSSSHLVPSSCPGRLGQAFTSPRGLRQVPPHPSQAQTPSRSNPAALRQIWLDKQALAQSLPNSLHPISACPHSLNLTKAGSSEEFVPTEDTLVRHLQFYY